MSKPTVIISGERHSFGIEYDANTSTVNPTHPVEKLMYYLHCIDYCMGSNVIDAKHRNYAKYFILNQQEKAEVIVLALAFSPDKLMEAKAMIMVENGNSILQGCSNKFLNLSDRTTTTTLGINQNAMVQVEGRSVKVHHLLVVSQGWLENYWYNPIKSEGQKLVGAPTSSRVTELPDTDKAAPQQNITLCQCLCITIFCPVLVLFGIAKVCCCPDKAE